MRPIKLTISETDWYNLSHGTETSRKVLQVSLVQKTCMEKAVQEA